MCVCSCMRFPSSSYYIWYGDTRKKTCVHFRKFSARIAFNFIHNVIKIQLSDEFAMDLHCQMNANTKAKLCIEKMKQYPLAFRWYSQYSTLPNRTLHFRIGRWWCEIVYTKIRSTTLDSIQRTWANTKSTNQIRNTPPNRCGFGLCYVHISRFYSYACWDSKQSR